jgi:hypothetical protein
MAQGKTQSCSKLFLCLDSMKHPTVTEFVFNLILELKQY